MPFVKPSEPQEISTGNPAFSWGKWKQKFEIYLKATGASKKPDEMKVGLLLNHIGESCLEIYSNFVYLPERDDPAGGEDKLPAENPDDYATVLAKFDEYFHKRDPQLMLREKFWLHLTRDSTQTFDSWVVTVNERAAECKFPANFYEQSVRDKLTFSCKEDSYKLKLYDEGAALSLDRPIQILSLKEATKRELQESKTAEIESITKRDIAPYGGNGAFKGNMQDPRKIPLQSRGKIADTATASTVQVGGIVQLQQRDASSATKFDIFLKYAGVHLLTWLVKFQKLRVIFAPHLLEELRRSVQLPYLQHPP